MTWEEGLILLAKQGGKAHTDGDGGRSQYLFGQVSAAMDELTLIECEWIAAAVAAGSTNRHFRAEAETPLVVTVTDNGEVWDL